jgi:2-oxoglutarate dehydrogenase E1 component
MPVTGVQTCALPIYGYEGMGSEHSSGRLERFLQLCAQENLQIANCTLPSNYFHLLRRQLKRDFRKPLVVFTPKKLLRFPRATSKLAEFSSGSFLEIIDDPETQNADVVVFCSGKFYYDLLEKKEELSIQNMAIVRMEQLYPFPEKQIDKIIAKYGEKCKYLWAQEEPENMGAWSFIMRYWKFGPITCCSRHSSASPASGSPKDH